MDHYLPNNSKNNDSKNKKKLNFNTYKDNTMKSLNEIEHFLRNFKNISKAIKIKKILK